MKGVNAKTWLIVGGLILGLVVTYVVATKAIPNMLVTFTKAAPASTVSISGSYLIGQKILAKADGVDKCVINVFAVDESGKGVSGKTVELTGADGIAPVGTVTDSAGKMSFEVTSLKEGQFTLEATIGGVPLPRKIKVTFRNN